MAAIACIDIVCIVSYMLRFFVVDAFAPSIRTRSRRLIAVQGGVRVVDTLFPVARGQRELIIGDRQTGKSMLVSSMFAGQCELASVMSMVNRTLLMVSSVGQRIVSIVRYIEWAESNDVRWISSVSCASVTTTMSSQFISPLSATAITESRRNYGAAASISYDDLSKHAVAYRQLCLYLRKPAGREAFPSDVFYLHARLLERSCSLSARYSLGSLMSLPIIETLNNDLSAYIATNVISITDGQLYLDAILFGIGVLPAVSTEKSVSRVGAKSLETLFRLISFRMYSTLGDVKQSGATKGSNDTPVLQYWLYTSSFVQRSPASRSINTLLLMSVATALAVSLPSDWWYMLLASIVNLSTIVISDTSIIPSHSSQHSVISHLLLPNAITSGIQMLEIINITRCISLTSIVLTTLAVQMSLIIPSLVQNWRNTIKSSSAYVYTSSNTVAHDSNDGPIMRWEKSILIFYNPEKSRKEVLFDISWVTRVGICVTCVFDDFYTFTFLLYR